MLEMIGDICSKIFELSLFHIAIIGGCIYGFVRFILCLLDTSSSKNILYGFFLWIGTTLYVAAFVFVLLFIIMGGLALLLTIIGAGFGTTA